MGIFILPLIIIAFLLWMSIKQSPKATVNPRKYNVVIPLVIGIVTYIVLSVMASNLLNDGYDIGAKISNDVLFCSVIAIVISFCLAKSYLDRLIYFVVIVVISAIVLSNWKELGYGTAIILFLTHLAVIAVAAIKRNKPTFFK